MLRGGQDLLVQDSMQAAVPTLVLGPANPAARPEVLLYGEI